MTADELYDLFRGDVVDTVKDYLWSDDEVWSYMDEAYKMFVRLTGGISDSTSAVTEVPITAGTVTSEVSPLILKFRTAYLRSNGRKLDIITNADEPVTGRGDYNNYWMGMRDNTPGEVQYMMVGSDRNAKRGIVRWVRVPVVDDVCDISVYRLPLDKITPDSGSFDLYEVGEEHHHSLMLWMKKLAYGKQDAETFDRGRRDEYDKEFRAYCEAAKAEWERYKTKTHVVEYGGI